MTPKKPTPQPKKSAPAKKASPAAPARKPKAAAPAKKAVPTKATPARKAPTPKKAAPAPTPSTRKGRVKQDRPPVTPKASTRALAKEVAGIPGNPHALTDKQAKFVEEYLVDMNGTQAAIRSGYSIATARSTGHELLTKPDIQAAIADARKIQSERTGITADGVLRFAWDVLTADPRKLVEKRTLSCRYCYGIGHQYQRTLPEMNKAMEDWRKKGESMKDFDEQGGIGYRPQRAPHPDCPECAGAGRALVVLADTRDFGPKEVALYAGVKQTKEGLEVKMQPKDAFAEKLFKHLGLYDLDNRQKSDALQTLLHSIAQGNGNGFKPVAEDPEFS